MDPGLPDFHLMIPEDYLTVTQSFQAVVDKNEFHSSIGIWPVPGN